MAPTKNVEDNMNLYLGKETVEKRQVSVYLDLDVIEEYDKFGNSLGKGGKSLLVNKLLRNFFSSENRYFEDFAGENQSVEIKDGLIEIKKLRKEINVIKRDLDLLKIELNSDREDKGLFKEVSEDTANNFKSSENGGYKSNLIGDQYSEIMSSLKTILKKFDE
ncbi:hypothetical protein [Rossellomorea marisflavi]|uniref:hypothetical protein n=1 Tax=Rossellomorea marisflavi TaxID=189381 RepID=UPI00064F9A46|nr:hypothetical protein [Rossellomorea marisflavi]KML07131.1 hypothetical protein VL06_04185 [Rossellomorea marisflavi]